MGQPGYPGAPQGYPGQPAQGGYPGAPPQGQWPGQGQPTGYPGPPQGGFNQGQPQHPGMQQNQGYGQQQQHNQRPCPQCGTMMHKIHQLPPGYNQYEGVECDRCNGKIHPQQYQPNGMWHCRN